MKLRSLSQSRSRSRSFNKSLSVLLLGALSVSTATALGGCSSPEQDAENSESAATAARDDKFGPALFRNDFYSYLKDVKSEGGVDRYSDDDIRKLVYLPTKEVMKPALASLPPRNANVAVTGAERRNALDEAFKPITPSALYEAGKNAPFERQAVADLEDVLADDPVHIIIVPGIFGEFIPRTPFDELFAQQSIMRTEWERKGDKSVAKCLSSTSASDGRLLSDNNPPSPGPDGTIDGCDLRYNVKKLANDWRPLSETTKDLISGEMRQTGLVRVASIDGKGRNGVMKPLATVAYLRAGIGSLEDFGTLEDDNKVYLRRLDAYFKTLGQVPKNLYIMGYSRGTTTGLDLLVRARRDVAKHPWAKNIKGFVAHAGVIYGSQLADASFNQGSPGAEALNLLRAFVGEKDGEGNLLSCEGSTQEERANADASLLLRSKNFVAYTKFGFDFAALTLKNLDFTNPGHRDEMRAEGIDTSLPNVGRISTFAGRVLGFRLPNSGLDEPNELEGVVSLSDDSIAYCRNVEAFKTTARAIVLGAETLTTRARDDWWSQKENALPTDVRYFALTGTMGDPGNKELSTNRIAYDPGSVDFRSLRGNYYDLLQASGNQLQDSQVPVQRGRFWPELHKSTTGFNRAQQGSIKTYFMGTVGVHHWGLAFPRAFSSNDGLEANPFPRTVLLKSVATFVAQVAKRDR